MTDLQPARGTHDLIGEDQRRHARSSTPRARTAALYGFDEWSTPIFEDTRVFARTLGDTSDVVTKEMYTFDDRGGDSLTLRPEGTAGICRALVTNGLTQSLPQKVFYAGPMFRYERPQKGRYRQFHQIGAELIGAAEPLADAEVIACGWDILHALGRRGRHGAGAEHAGRPRQPRRLPRRPGGLFHRAPRRAVGRQPGPPGAQPDAHPGQQGRRRPPLVAGRTDHRAVPHRRGRRRSTPAAGPSAPFGVPFRENPRIVRGLDYYSHTAFEFVTDRLGAQGTVMAGGRYDGLVEEMGGPPTPAVGWAAGIERVAMLLADRPGRPAPVAVIPIGEAAEAAAIDVLQTLRRAGIRAEMAYRGNCKRRMERANRIGARAAVILGDDEIARGVAQVKDLHTGAQEEVALARPRRRALR